MKRFLNSDVNLVQRIKKNDKQAFELIFNKFKEKLYYFGMGYLHSEAETKEIIQNVFVSLWENRDMLNEAYPIQNYLYKATINHIYNFFKHQSVRQKYADHVAISESYVDRSSEESIIVNDLEEIVDSFVRELPLKQQVIYKLSRHDGLCHAEIAERLGLSVRSVENQIYRALKYIREKLKEESLLTE